MKNLRLIIGIFLFFTMIAIPASLAQAEIGGDQGVYEVRSNVDGASVYFDDTFIGYINQGVLDVPVSTTGTPYKTYTVSKPGYVTYMAPILEVPAPGGTIVLHATLRLNPVVGLASLNILSTPPGATVYLDGVNEGQVPPSGVLIVDQVTPGNHAIEMQLSGFQTFTTEVTVNPNEVKIVRAVLIPQITGGISVTSVPTGASIYIDDQFRGASPVTVNDLTPGTHTVIVRLIGYQDWSTPVQVNAGVTIQVSASLAPAVPVSTTSASPTKAGGLPVIVFFALGTALILPSVLKRIK